MKATTIILAALLMAAPLTMTSCSVVSQIRTVDMSQIPGLSAVSKAQEDMMSQYGSSARLLLRSRMAALEALEMDARAYANAKKAGSEYDKAVKIAAGAKERMADVQAQLTNLNNKPDMDVISKAVESTKDVDDFVQEGYKTMASIAKEGNDAVAAQNAKGDKMVRSAVRHVAGANAKIVESYSLLQDAQIEEVKLTTTAIVQSRALIKAMKNASALDKAALGVTFRPIVYFLTGLPGELEEQENIKAMWQEHSNQVAGIKLPAAKKLPDIKSQAADIAKDVVSSFVPGLGSFGF